MKISFYIDSVPFTQGVIDGQTSLGGSESACRTLAEALARRGHTVKVFATKMTAFGGLYHGVEWIPAEQLREYLASTSVDDVFVALRADSAFQYPMTAKLVIWWLEDNLIHPTTIETKLQQVDRLVYVSRYQQHQWESLSPLCAQLFGWVTTNPFDPLTSLQPVTREPHRLIYASRPERGLQALLQMWPTIRARIPDAVLGICRYESAHDFSGETTQLCRSFDLLAADVNASVGGIEFLGRLDKPHLYRELQRATVLAYPGHFAETNCLIATEAQAYGAIVVGSWIGALPETVHRDAGVLIHGANQSETYQETYINVLAALCAGDVDTRLMRQAGYDHAKTAEADAVATQWERELDTLLANHRPTPRVVAALIVKNDETWLPRCLSSVKPFVDDIVVYDTGSTDESVMVAESYGAHVYQGIWKDDEGFAWARNESVACAELMHHADWILWLDADEELVNGYALRAYTSGRGPYRAYHIRQANLSLDGPLNYQYPARLFKANDGIRFYGAIHEMPEDAPDAGIAQSCDLNDLGVVHYGYLQDAWREQRRQNRTHELLPEAQKLTRNSDLLQAEFDSGKPRRYAWFLLMRDLMREAVQQRQNGTIVQQASDDKRIEVWRLTVQNVILLWDEHFAERGSPHRAIAYPVYREALKMLGAGVSCEFSCRYLGGMPCAGNATGFPTLKGETLVDVIYASDYPELASLVKERLDDAIQNGRPPKGWPPSSEPVVEGSGWGVSLLDRNMAKSLR